MYIGHVWIPCMSNSLCHHRVDSIHAFSVTLTLEKIPAFCPNLIEMQTTSTAEQKNWRWEDKGFRYFCGYRLGHVCNCFMRFQTLKCTNVNIEESKLNKMLFKQYGTNLSPSLSSSTQYWGKNVGGLVDGGGRSVKIELVT